MKLLKCLFVRHIAVFCLLLSSQGFANTCEGYFSVFRDWTAISNQYVEASSSSMSFHRSLYNKPSDYRSMLELLGFQFKENIQAPRLEALLQNYHRIMRVLVQKNNLKEYFIPVFEFTNGDDIVYLEFQEPIPDGFYLQNSPITYTTIFYQLLENNKILMGDLSLIYSDPQFKILSLDHGVAHLTTFMQFPEIMPILKKLASHHDGRVYEVDDYPYFLAFEVWNYIPKKHLQEVRSFIQNILMDDSLNNNFISTDVFIKKLKLMTREEFYDFSVQLKKNLILWLDSSGGLMRSPLSLERMLKNAETFNYNVEEDNEFLGFYFVSNLIPYQLARFVNRELLFVDPSLSPYVNSNSHQVNLQIIANILSILDGLTKIEILDVYNSFEENGFKRNSPLEKMYQQLKIRNLKQSN